METIKQQYELIKSAREVVLDYYDSIKYDDLIKPIESFNNGSMQYLILHIANTYIFWLKGFCLKEKFEYFTEENVHSAADIRNAFIEVNLVVDKFLNSFGDLNTPIEGEIFWLKKNMTFTVLELAAHVFTHEFHHKGQVMSMSRMLGYTPPDADIIRF
jgi:uncharacterized damage-inducible protein DinB